MLRNPIGTHLKIGSGLVAGALTQARELGCEVLQIFVGNPRGWALSPGNPDEDHRFTEACTEVGMRVVIHAPYLINLGSPTEQTYLNSVRLLAHNLRRAGELGAEGVVVHTGSYVDRGDDPMAAHERALGRVRDGLLPILDSIDDPAAPWLLLEPTAGQGRSLCSDVADLEAYLGAVDFHPKAGICLDTCHLFAAGEPLDEPGGTTETVDRLVALGGPGRLRLVHANDSKDPRGSQKDRHERLGAGHIGITTFRELLAHPATEGVPFVLETPGSRTADDDGIPTLRALRDQVGVG